eukprot:Platyproteum_vivax@DN2567_c0_g1_i1.p1
MSEQNVKVLDYDNQVHRELTFLRSKLQCAEEDLELLEQTAREEISLLRKQNQQYQKELTVRESSNRSYSYSLPSSTYGLQPSPSTTLNPHSTKHGDHKRDLYSQTNHDFSKDNLSKVQNVTIHITPNSPILSSPSCTNTAIQLHDLDSTHCSKNNKYYSKMMAPPTELNRWKGMDWHASTDSYSSSTVPVSEFNKLKMQLCELHDSWLALQRQLASQHTEVINLTARVKELEKDKEFYVSEMESSKVKQKKPIRSVVVQTITAESVQNTPQTVSSAAAAHSEDTPSHLLAAPTPSHLSSLSGQSGFDHSANAAQPDDYNVDKQLRQVFNRLDTDQDGYITGRDLVEGVRKDHLLRMSFSLEKVDVVEGPVAEALEALMVIQNFPVNKVSWPDFRHRYYSTLQWGFLGFAQTFGHPAKTRTIVSNNSKSSTSSIKSEIRMGPEPIKPLHSLPDMQAKPDYNYTMQVDITDIARGDRPVEPASSQGDKRRAHTPKRGSRSNQPGVPSKPGVPWPQEASGSAMEIKVAPSSRTPSCSTPTLQFTVTKPHPTSTENFSRSASSLDIAEKRDHHNRAIALPRTNHSSSNLVPTNVETLTSSDAPDKITKSSSVSQIDSLARSEDTDTDNKSGKSEGKTGVARER